MSGTTPYCSKESDLITVAKDLLYLGPKRHGSELCLERPMRGRDGDWGSWKILGEKFAVCVWLRR